MKSILKAAAAALVGLSMLAAPAYATTVYDLQAEQGLEASQAVNELFGFSRDPYHSDLHAALASEETRDWTVRLQGGKTYKFIGACDRDCTDFDLNVKENGRMIAGDYQTDNIPMVTVRALSDTYVTLHMFMSHCNAAPCSAAVRILSQ